MAKKPKLSLTKAVKYYRAGYPDDSMCNYAYYKSHPSEATAVIEEVSAFVHADSLEKACRLAVKFDYGCGPHDDPNNWRSHVEAISNIRRAAGHYEPDYSPEGIVKDLLELVQSLEEECGTDSFNMSNVLSYTGKNLENRIEMVYGRLWEESK